jgi:two-component system cell cycle response regulator
MRVVIAHACPDTRTRFARVLAAVGHEATEVATAAEAIERCRAEAPDVAVVDVQLTDRGEEPSLLGALKSDANAYRTAVVLLEQPDLDLDGAVAALRRGVQDFLVEPVTDGELVARVEAAGRTKGLQEELVVQARRLETLIFEDPLTGLANRRFILTQLGGLVSGARRHGRALSIAVIDIDHFKAVNDRYGHAAGDAVLAAVTAALRGRLRAEDQLGRLGGEEFLALFPDADADAAAVAARKLCAEVARTTVAYEGRDLGVTVSIGWATWEGERPEKLLRRADDALYEAKGRGRDRVAGAAASLHRRT